ncbi:DUF58 domain-containing protein [Piscinibacter sakaiensis]|uniref:DUF58 domain-containing protein n=1 Tax=Piscinibacter sakaiensis TaxID=1547922 RepID=UPI00372C0D26
MFALTLFTLLLASINYQLNLGYLLTFLLAGSGLASMHLTHGNLRGLQLHLKPVAPVHAGDAALLEVVLAAPPAARAPRHGDGQPLGRAEGGSETEGVRAYRRGDPPKWVLWKKAAKQLEGGGELSSRDTRTPVRRQLWLDWQEAAGLAPEDRLSRLAAWVVAADRQELLYGLRLPGRELAPDRGDAHRRACLEALALWQ